MEEYTKPRIIRERLSYWKIGLTIWLQLRSSSQGCRWFFKKKNSSAYGTVYYPNRDNPVPNCPNSYTPMNAGRLRAPSERGPFNEPVARTVHIPWLVASYDKRWLNSNPQTTGPKHCIYNSSCNFNNWRFLMSCIGTSAIIWQTLTKHKCVILGR